MSLILNESLVLAKTRSQDLRSVLKLNCWGSGIKDVSLVRQLVNVEVIGLSCNEITTLEDFAYCPKLKELILRKNKIKNISEIAHLQRLPKLTSLWLDENPCAENTYNYRKVVLKALPNLTLLDNVPVTREELQEIEELGNDIYEEIPYESTNSSGSGSSSTPAIPTAPISKPQILAENEPTETLPSRDMITYSNNNEQSINETSFYQPNETSECSFSQSSCGQLVNELQSINNSINMKSTLSATRSSVTNQQPSRCFSSQGSVTALNGGMSQQCWSSSNNNTILPKGGKSRNGNILSAVLCLVKELDYVSCEVVQTALNCRMEEMSQ